MFPIKINPRLEIITLTEHSNYVFGSPVALSTKKFQVKVILYSTKQNSFPFGVYKMFPKITVDSSDTIKH